MIKLYTRTCAPCQYRVQLSHLKAYASRLNTELKIIETIGRPDLEQKAKDLTDVTIPFVYNTETRGSIAMREVTREISI